MEIQLTAKQIKITDAIRAYVQEKTEKAQKYFDHIVWGQVFLFVEKQTHKCEMLIHTPGQTFRAIAEASDLYSAVDLASDKTDAQIKKFKEKMRAHHKARHGRESIRLESEDADFGGSRFFVIRQGVSPMSAEEAAKEMEAQGQSFRLYQDRESKQIHVVFRRSDETYGILQPVKKAPVKS